MNATLPKLQLLSKRLKAGAADDEGETIEAMTLPRKSPLSQIASCLMMTTI
jgi:hypothetical protein